MLALRDDPPDMESLESRRKFRLTENLNFYKMNIIPIHRLFLQDVYTVSEPDVENTGLETFPYPCT